MNLRRGAIVGITAIAPLCGLAAERERPNIIWFMAEDISPQLLALFNGGKGCKMPSLERLASEGMVYPNAYSNAPVSSAARTTLITGCYAPSFAGSLHRKMQESPMPEGLHMAPYYLSKAGYYTINAQKTDYNVALDTEAWDHIKGDLKSWRNRKEPDRPFFMQRTVALSHESCLLFTKEHYKSIQTQQNPQEVNLLPHSPDTDLMRYSYATLYDRLVETDRELGELIEMLKEDGEYDNTIIFFFGDNGGTVPGTKGYCDNVGLQVPLVVYVPPKWREKIGAEAGVVRSDLVSFIDFAATTLNIAEAEIPDRMDGTPFLGKGSSRGVESIVCYGDRFDELYSLNRSIRKGDFRYERNFQPYQRQSLFALYRYKQMAFREWRELYEKGELNSAQSRFFSPQGIEELYNLADDPYELNNLATDHRYRSKLEEMRQDLNGYMVERCDLGLFPETILLEEAMESPDSFGRRNRERIGEFIHIADLQRLPFKEAKRGIKSALKSDDYVKQWWALTTLASFGHKAKEFRSMAREMLTGERAFIRSRAMLFLSMIGEPFSPTEIKSILKECRGDAEMLLVLGDFAIMVSDGYIKPFPITVEEAPATNFAIEWRVRYLQALYNGTPLSVICDSNFGK